MRWLLFFILVAAGLWYIRGIEDAPRPTAEESFIGGPVKTLRKAEGVEQSYLDATEQRKKKMEEQLEKDGG